MKMCVFYEILCTRIRENILDFTVNDHLRYMQNDIQIQIRKYYVILPLNDIVSLCCRCTSWLSFSCFLNINKMLDKEKPVIDNNVGQVSISIQYTREMATEMWRCNGLIYSLFSYWMRTGNINSFLMHVRARKDILWNNEDASICSFTVLIYWRINVLNGEYLN